MLTLDVFRSDPGFGMLELTAAVEHVPYVPQFLRTLNLFTPKPVTTEFVAIEERDQVLSLIQTTPRGAPLQEFEKRARNIRALRTVRIAEGETIQAGELQGIRAFGEVSEMEQLQTRVARDMATIRAKIELTHENMRLGAIQGRVLDADGSELLDLFTLFNVAEPAEIAFNFAVNVDGALREICNQTVRAVQRAAKGAWLPTTRLVALCADDFFDALTKNAEVRESYLAQQEASELRQGNAFQSFDFGGITWTNYRGTDDGTTVTVAAEKCRFIPVGAAPELFQVAFSPAESFQFVNTPGRELYALSFTDVQRDQWARIELYSYPMYYCTRPGMLFQGRMGA